MESYEELELLILCIGAAYSLSIYCIFLRIAGLVW